MLLCMLFCVSNLQSLTYAAGYIPNVQFAPFFVAIERGYYAEAGIDIKMDYTIGADIFKLLAQKKVDIASADPDAFLNACEQGLPLVHVASFYQTYPISLISPFPINSKQDLMKKRVGISGLYGSSYLGFKALCQQLDMELSDAQLVAIGFSQVSSLKSGSVDAVIGYLNNEPIRLEALGMPVHVTSLKHQTALPGVGFAVHKENWGQNKELYEAFLKATFRGLVDVVLEPETCFELIAPIYLPGVNPNPEHSEEFEVLRATLGLWTNTYTKKNGFGQCDPMLWENLRQLLAKQGQPIKSLQCIDFSFRYPE